MGAGRPPDRGAPATELLRFRATEAEAAEIRAALDERKQSLSAVALELLLAWARR